MNRKFKLLKTIESNKNHSNFWKCCPRKLDYFPTEECSEAIPDLDKSNKVIEEPKCPWWINSKKHNYCFWTYVKDKSNELGEMPELVQSDLAKLFGWSNTKAHFTLKEALESLINILKSQNIDIELEDLADHYNLDDYIKFEFSVPNTDEN